jgi:SAM-dependent MidA family methyltransferase
MTTSSRCSPATRSDGTSAGGFAVTHLLQRSTPLGSLLAARIRENGPLTFCEYMRACLYHPEHGYYAQPAARRRADYYTSVDVHPIFGRLLARQLAGMWEALGKPQEFLAVECGAGEGRLAGHILDFAARALPEFHASLRYVVVEWSPAGRAAHARNLASHLAAGRARSAADLPERVPAGCIFSNELLDALPVHRVVCEQDELREIYVTLEGRELCERSGPLSSPALAEFFAEQGVALAEGQQAEAGLEACGWIATAGQRLDRGFVLTVDYGHEAEELYNQRHLRGTLLAYQPHRAGEDFFTAPGEQDLTAHVNFTALNLYGRAAGLERTGLVSQTQFLLALGRGNDFLDLYDHGQSEVERVRARLMLKSLIYPEGMGETFRVFIQHKGIAAPRLAGLEPL